MARISKRRSREPGVLSLRKRRGEGAAEAAARPARKLVSPPRITVIDYTEGALEELELKNIEEAFLYRDRPTNTWINIEGVQQLDLIDKLGAYFNIHPLVLEDIVNTSQRAKQEAYPDYVFVVLRMLSSPRGQEVAAEQISIVVGRHWLITFQEGLEGDVLGPVRQKLRDEKSGLRKQGVDFLAHAILDAIVDNYFGALEVFGERVEQLELSVISDPSDIALRRVYDLRREMLFFRRVIWPVRDLISGLQREGSALISEQARLYFRDVYDHVVQVMEITEIFREMVSGMMEIYLSSINNRLNVVMKTLAVIATIFMPLTFISSIYGMNFSHMPEIGWRYGYPFALVMMAVIGVSMVVFFKKRKWI